MISSTPLDILDHVHFFVLNKQIDYQRVMELYCTLDLGIYHQDVGDCLMSTAFKAIDRSRQVGY